MKRQEFALGKEKYQREQTAAGGWVSGLSILPHKPEDLSLIPRTHIKKTTRMMVLVCNPSAGRDTWVPEALLPGRPA